MQLRAPALRGDWPAWAEAWRQLDATECASLLAQLDSGQRLSLTLCGERNAQTWIPRAQGGYLGNMTDRITRFFSSNTALAALEKL